jgi:hypothetical protein
MLSVGSQLTSALAALNAVTVAEVQPAAPTTVRHAGNALTGASRLTLSSATGDALLRFTSIAAGTQSEAASPPARAAVVTAPAPSSTTSDTGIPADRLAWLDSLGAERWELREPQTLDDAGFEQRVMESLYKNGSAKLAGFADARANGSLKIQRAADMPELGYRSFQVTLYKDGEAYGGVGFSVANTEHWTALRESGIYAGTGSVSGVDYVVTWPMPLTSADDEPGIYSAT